MGRESDANDAARDTARLKAIHDIAANGPRIADRFGRPILLGCEVEMHGELPPVYQVVDAKPDLSKNAQPGVWILTLVSELPVICKNGQRHGKMTVVAFPDLAQQADTQPPAAADGPAASDTPAAPPSSIILTDMDKQANETLEAAPLKQGLSLVPSLGEEQAHAEERGAPFAGHHSDLGEER